MKRLLIALLAAMAVAGCSDSARTVNFPAMPADFADCKVVRVSNSNGAELTLARCPNSTTTTRTTGKNPRTTIVVDGKTYEAME